MNVTKKSKSENKSVILGGIVLGVLFSLYITELFQYMTASIVGADNLHIQNSGINFYTLFYMDAASGIFSSAVAFLSPYILTAVVCESVLFYLEKIGIGRIRFFLIVFLMIITGYLIVSIFYGCIISILNGHSYNDTTLFFSHLKFGQLSEIGIIFFFVFLTLIYSSSIFKRVQGYVTSL